MLFPRVIPVLLIEDGRLVKTTKFRKSSYIGDPINTVRIFNDKCVDELIVLDIEASRRSQPPNFQLIERITSEAFMPVTYGGGVGSVEQAALLVDKGVEKISLQSAALRSPNIIRDIAHRFGSQSVVGSLDIVRNRFGIAQVYDTSRKKILKVPLAEVIESWVKAGIGELLVTAVDREGTFGGPDIDLITSLASRVPVPLVASGGVGSIADLRAIIEAGASGAGAGSFFVYQRPHRAVLVTYPNREEIQQIVRPSPEEVNRN